MRQKWYLTINATLLTLPLDHFISFLCLPPQRLYFFLDEFRLFHTAHCCWCITLDFRLAYTSETSETCGCQCRPGGRLRCWRLRALLAHCEQKKKAGVSDTDYSALASFTPQIDTWYKFVPAAQLGDAVGRLAETKADVAAHGVERAVQAQLHGDDVVLVDALLVHRDLVARASKVGGVRGCVGEKGRMGGEFDRSSPIVYGPCKGQRTCRKAGGSAASCPPPSFSRPLHTV